MLLTLLSRFRNFAWVGTKVPWFNTTPTKSSETLVSLSRTTGWQAGKGFLS
jgi:hypothetical protein